MRLAVLGAALDLDSRCTPSALLLWAEPFAFAPFEEAEPRDEGLLAAPDDVAHAVGFGVVGLGPDGLLADGLGVETAFGTAVVGAAPLPKRNPTTLPDGAGREAAPRLAYAHAPPRLALKTAQYAFPGGMRGHIVLTG